MVYKRQAILMSDGVTKRQRKEQLAPSTSLEKAIYWQLQGRKLLNEINQLESCEQELFMQKAQEAYGLFEEAWEILKVDFTSRPNLEGAQSSSLESQAVRLVIEFVKAAELVSRFEKVAEAMTFMCVIKSNNKEDRLSGIEKLSIHSADRADLYSSVYRVFSRTLEFDQPQGFVFNALCLAAQSYVKYEADYHTIAQHYKWIGDWYFRAKNWQDSEINYNEAIKYLWSCNPPTSAWQMDEITKSQQIVERLKLEVYLRLGQAYMALMRFELAGDIFETGFSLIKTNSNPNQNIREKEALRLQYGHFLFEDAEFSKALEILNPIASKDDKCLSYIAQSHIALDDFQAAYSTYESFSGPLGLDAHNKVRANLEIHLPKLLLESVTVTTLLRDRLLDLRQNTKHILQDVEDSLLSLMDITLAIVASRLDTKNETVLQRLCSVKQSSILWVKPAVIEMIITFSEDKDKPSLKLEKREIMNQLHQDDLVLSDGERKIVHLVRSAFPNYARHFNYLFNER